MIFNNKINQFITYNEIEKRLVDMKYNVNYDLVSPGAKWTADDLILKLNEYRLLFWYHGSEFTINEDKKTIRKTFIPKEYRADKESLKTEKS